MRATRPSATARLTAPAAAAAFVLRPSRCAVTVCVRPATRQGKATKAARRTARAPALCVEMESVRATRTCATARLTAPAAAAAFVFSKSRCAVTICVRPATRQGKATKAARGTARAPHDHACLGSAASASWPKGLGRTAMTHRDGAASRGGLRPIAGPAPAVRHQSTSSLRSELRATALLHHYMPTDSVPITVLAKFPSALRSVPEAQYPEHDVQKSVPTRPCAAT